MPVNLSQRDQLVADNYRLALAEVKQFGAALGMEHQHQFASPQEINAIYGMRMKTLAERLGSSLRPPRVAWQGTNLVLFVVGVVMLFSGAYGSSTVSLVLGFLVLLAWGFSGLARLIVNVGDKAAREQFTKMLYSAGIDEIMRQLNLRRFDRTSER
jgi:hypothetical protein